MQAVWECVAVLLQVSSSDFKDAAHRQEHRWALLAATSLTSSRKGIPYREVLMHRRFGREPKRRLSSPQSQLVPITTPFPIKSGSTADASKEAMPRLHSLSFERSTARGHPAVRLDAW
jgi:hypothetical protein